MDKLWIVWRKENISLEQSVTKKGCMKTLSIILVLLNEGWRQNKYILGGNCAASYKEVKIQYSCIMFHYL